MCGIAGIATLRPEPQPLLARMAEAVRHRGPDDHGYLAWSGESTARIGRDWPGNEPVRVGLAHRRLAIIDLSEGGWQPMASADNSLHVVYNGEIYNYLELRAELGRLGHGFRTESDTEVLLAAWQQWGTRALPRLTGMFAFALLDLAAGRLVLARDPFGIKPLYMTVGEGRLAFASEIKALLELPWVDRRIDPQSAYEYLVYGSVDRNDATQFASIRALPPATSLEIDLTTLRVGEPASFWRVPRAARVVDMPVERAAEELRRLFVASVGLHMRSDVTVGAALSGGIDSSSIVCAMRGVSAPGQALHCFGFMAEDAAISEERWMRLVETHTTAMLHPVHLKPDDLRRELDALIDIQDEPFGSTSIYAQYKVFQAARAEGVIVMLDGQGADEGLGGYWNYLGHKVADCVKAMRPLALLRYLLALRGLPHASPGGTLAHGMATLLPVAARDRLRALNGTAQRPNWLRAGWIEDADITPGVTWRNEGAGLDVALRRSLEEASLPALLRYEDRNSMAHSIESRVPFLTTEVMEFLFRLPPHYLIDDGATTKSVFRQAMRGLVPDAILDRRDKIGFQTPEQRWLSVLAPWIDGILAGAGDLPIFDAGVVTAHWQAVRDGRRNADARLWRWINFVRWVEIKGVTVT
jgi:asparagine synthase (glutamine-hydrolysing)